MKPDPIKIPPRDVSEDQCDLVLGHYMRAWNQLEMASFALFRKLLDTDITTASIIFFAEINQRTMRRMMSAMGKARLKPANQRTLEALLDRCNIAAVKRNRLVHGNWHMTIDLGPDYKTTGIAKSATWVRLYHPSDPSDLDRMHGPKRDQKLLARHRFTISDITNATTDARALARDVGAFAESVAIQPARIPMPIELWSQPPRIE